MQAAGEPRELDLLLVEAQPRRDARGELGDARGVAARVRVARVDRLGEARGGAEARRPVGARREPPQLGELDHVGPVDVHPVLAVLLRPVERAVGEADQLVAVRRLAREGRDAGADGHRADVLEAELRDPLDDRGRGRDRLALVVAGRSSANSSPPSRNASPFWRSVAASRESTRSPAGWPKRSLTRLKSSTSTRQRLKLHAVPLGLDQLALEPLVEMAVVAEPGQRVGQREPHRAERAVGRALVERDREQRADEGRGQKRRALPEDDEHERGRRHQREEDDRPAQAGADQLEERPPRRDGHDERDEHEVDPVLRRGRDADLGDQRVGSVAGDEADAAAPPTAAAHAKTEPL